MLRNIIKNVANVSCTIDKQIIRNESLAFPLFLREALGNKTLVMGQVGEICL